MGSIYFPCFITKPLFLNRFIGRYSYKMYSPKSTKFTFAETRSTLIIQNPLHIILRSICNLRKLSPFLFGEISTSLYFKMWIQYSRHSNWTVGMDFQEAFAFHSNHAPKYFRVSIRQFQRKISQNRKVCGTVNTAWKSENCH